MPDAPENVEGRLTGNLGRIHPEINALRRQGLRRMRWRIVGCGTEAKKVAMSRTCCKTEGPKMDTSDLVVGAKHRQEVGGKANFALERRVGGILHGRPGSEGRGLVSECTRP